MTPIDGSTQLCAPSGSRPADYISVKYETDAGEAMAPAPPDTSEQPTLRVMRLYKPRLDGRRVLPSCSVAASPGEAAREAVTTGEGDFALGSALKLPDSFGNIYLGETFTAYISVLNHMSSTVLVNASLSAKLQSPTGRVDLEDRRMARGASASRPNPTPLLSPSENLDMIVEHTLGELGTHTLRVTVRYHVAGDPEGSEPRSMRKFYRFSVMNPVNMSSVCTAVRGGPFVELQLANTTQMDLLLDSCDFVPEDGVSASLIGGGGRDGGDAAPPSSWAMEGGRQTEVGEEGGRRALAGGAGAEGNLERAAAAGGGAGTRRRDRWWRGGVRGRDGVSPLAGEIAGTGSGRRRGAEDDDRDVEDVTAVERFDGRVLLRPEETHQLIYSVRPNKVAITTATILTSTLGGAPGEGFDGPAAAEEEGEREDGGGEGEGGFGEGSHTLGQVEVCWRTTTGESGSVKSGPIVFEAVERPEVEVTVDGLPDVLKLGRVVACVATVRNRSSRPMTLQLQFRTDGMVGVYVHGQSFRNLGELLPGTCVRCPLQLLALVAGLHELRGCTVADMHTAQEFSQGKLRDVLVEFPTDEEEEAEAVIATEDSKHGVLGM